MTTTDVLAQCDSEKYVHQTVLAYATQGSETPYCYSPSGSRFYIWLYLLNAQYTIYKYYQYYYI